MPQTTKITTTHAFYSPPLSWLKISHLFILPQIYPHKLMRSALRSSKTSKRKKVRARIVWQEDTKLDHIRFFDAKSPANHNRGENFTFDKKDVSMYEDEAPPWEALQQQRATTLNQPTDDPSISFTVPPRRPRRKSWEIPPREVSVLEASGHFSLHHDA